MQHEKYSLTWNAYSDHLKSMMKELMMNEDFSDVTLVTEDKKQIKANVNICLYLFLILSHKSYIREVFINHQFFHHALQMI